MTTSTTENETAVGTAVASEKPGAPIKVHGAPQKPDVAPAKGKSGKKARSTKKRDKAPKKRTKAKAESPREGSKTEKILELLKRSGGVTLKEIMKVTEWHPHSVRGFISGTLGKKMKLKIESAKGEGGERVYSLAK
jgi:hypothetical protein